MTTDRTRELTEELQHFQAEKEKIRQIVGQIGGTGSRKREKALTSLFVILLIILFVADAARYLFGIILPLPPLFSIEVGILLVSIKIIWMIHSQTRVEHFQFWILNSIEFRLDQISNRLREIEKQTQEIQKGEQDTSEPLRGSVDRISL
jgi:hypothetical protein